MSNRDAFQINFNRVRVTVEDMFYSGVDARADQLRYNVEAKVKEMFGAIAASFGGETAPSEVWETWPELTYDWARHKAKTKGKRRSYPNKFYVGETQSMQRFFHAQRKKFPFGTPEITISEGVSQGYSTKGPRLRIAKSTPDFPTSGGGRYAKAAEALRATITVIPFPKVNEMEDPTQFLMDREGRRGNGVKIGAGEYGTSNRPARPFLNPFLDYYSRIVIPDAMARTLRL